MILASTKLTCLPYLVYPHCVHVIDFVHFYLGVHLLTRKDDLLCLCRLRSHADTRLESAFQAAAFLLAGVLSALVFKNSV